MNHRHVTAKPSGWFHACFSEELSEGGVLAKQLFGHQVVVFRTESGTPHVLDAHCPHLGAHLGVGGVVQGETIVCPFHGWSFDGSGACVGVPYARSTPRLLGRRCVRAWRSVEANRSVYVWFHPRAQAPTFELARVAELSMDDGEWTPFLRREWTIRSHIQEAQENIVDAAHFRVVHGIEAVFDYSFDGPRSRVTMSVGTPGSTGASRVITQRNGPGQSWARYEGTPEFVVLDPVTPLDDEHIQLTLAVAFRRPQVSALERVHAVVFGEMCRQVERDIPIFENKVYRASPPLCDGDGPILEFRQWYGQFYEAGQGESRGPSGSHGGS